MKVLVLLAATLLLAGCGGVECENPASDAATTKFDERLIGFWRVDAKASGLDDDSDPTAGFVLVVGKHPDVEGGLLLVTVGLKNGTPKVDQTPGRSTTIGEKPYVSIHTTPPKDGKRGAWTVLRYDVPAEDTLRVLGMNEDEVARDVQSGKMVGTVQKPKPGDLEGTTMVTLSATVQALRAYLGSRGDAVFKSEHPLVLKRLPVR